MFYFCRTCGNQLPEKFMHDATHDIVLSNQIVPLIKMVTPIFKGLDNNWYFWDETWAYLTGPFKSLDEASINLQAYVDWLDRK